MTDQDITRTEWPPPTHATYIEILVGDYLDDGGEVAYLWAPAARQADSSYYVAVAWSPDVQALRPIDLVFGPDEGGCAWREITPERFARTFTHAGAGRINIPPHTVRAGDVIDTGDGKERVVVDNIQTTALDDNETQGYTLLDSDGNGTYAPRNSTVTLLRN